MTFVFTDIEGSTGAWDAHHGAMAEALSLHDTLVATVVTEHHGYVFSTGGDGVAAAFQSAREGVAAAAELQRRVGTASWPDPLKLRVRIGINTGDAVERDGDYFGPAVIRAARLMSLVDGGRTVCSAATASLVGPHLPSGVELVPLGTVRLRGLSGDESVFALAGSGLEEPGTALSDNRGVLRPPPRPLGRLVGRTAELAAVTGALADHPLVTVIGIGGMGKTRLAQEVARTAGDRFADGVAWADLATALDASAARHEIATALGVRAQTGDDVVAGIGEVLTHRNLLLVLDNCEHVRGEVALIVSHAAGGETASTVLATSRERLGLSHEHVIALGPLDLSGAGAARAMLADRLGGVASDDQASLDAIVAQVDGIPLAIELAAARCRSLGLQEVATRLSTQPRMLSDKIARHRTASDARRGDRLVLRHPRRDRAAGVPQARRVRRPVPAGFG